MDKGIVGIDNNYRIKDKYKKALQFSRVRCCTTFYTPYVRYHMESNSLSWVLKQTLLFAHLYLHITTQ